MKVIIFGTSDFAKQVAFYISQSIAYLGYKKIQSIKSLFLRKMLMKAK